MRVLMVNSNTYKIPLPPMPIGLCWVSASLENAGQEVRVLDLMFSTNELYSIIRIIFLLMKSKKPHFLF